MIKCFRPLIPSAAIFNCVLIFALSTAWATTTYTGSRTFKKGKGGKIKLVKGQDRIEFEVKKGALDPYLNEVDEEEVTINVTVTEELVDCEDDDYFRLEFVFGSDPEDVFFEEAKPGLLMLQGKYTDTACEVSLVDEEGEAVPAIVDTKKDRTTFLITSFSSYFYEQYDY